MKFAPGTDPKKAQEALIAAGYPAPRTPGATNSALPTVGPGALPPSSPDSPATPVPTKPPRRGGKNRRQAGMNFGLMPTEVIEQVRGRGYGLTYQPQQRTGKQIKFGGGGPQNVINFNPIMSQQANPNIRVGVEGARATQTANPQLTSSPIQESGPGSVYTGPNTGNFEEGKGNQTNPNVSQDPKTEDPKTEDPKTEDPKTQDPKPEKPKNNYQKRMNRYMRKYDRTAYGAGSSRGTDRFSAKDIRKMFRAGRKFGGSKKQAARDVLAYARRNRKKTKMGGTAKRQLAKLQQMLGRRRKEEKKRKSMTAKQQRKLDRKQRRRAKRKVRKYNKARRARRNKRRGRKKR